MKAVVLQCRRSSSRGRTGAGARAGFGEDSCRVRRYLWIGSALLETWWCRYVDCQRAHCARSRNRRPHRRRCRGRVRRRTREWGHCSPRRFPSPRAMYNGNTLQLSPDVDHFGSAARLPHSNGAFSEYVVVSASQIRVLPPHLDARIALVSEPLAVALHAVQRGGDLQGKSLVVNGAGRIGCSSSSAHTCCWGFGNLPWRPNGLRTHNRHETRSPPRGEDCTG